MTPEQFRAALAGLGYTQICFARLARVDPRTVRKWAAGDSRIPGPVVVLIELLKACPEARSRTGGSLRSPAGADRVVHKSQITHRAPARLIPTG